MYLFLDKEWRNERIDRGLKLPAKTKKDKIKASNQFVPNTKKNTTALFTSFLPPDNILSKCNIHTYTYINSFAIWKD